MDPCFQCPICEEYFENEESLNNHIKSCRNSVISSQPVTTASTVPVQPPISTGNAREDDGGFCFCCADTTTTSSDEGGGGWIPGADNGIPHISGNDDNYCYGNSDGGAVDSGTGGGDCGGVSSGGGDCGGGGGGTDSCD